VGNTVAISHKLLPRIYNGHNVRHKRDNIAIKELSHEIFLVCQDHPVMSRRIPGGVMPDCQKCGECFDNWDRILAGELLTL
jgi:hypothetical protein